MSLTRQFFREMAPMFRLLEQPFGRAPALHGSRNWNRFDPFQDLEVRPAIDVAEQGDKYVLDAELPGINKENIEIRVGDSGRSITIEGKVVEKSSPQPATEAAQPQDTNATSGSESSAVAYTEQQTQLSSERQFTRNFQFTRTVWLPRPVDAANVSAKLENGVLTILARKAEDRASTSIEIQ